jgi:exopolysaccharide biosynthesis protein
MKMLRPLLAMSIAACLTAAALAAWWHGSALAQPIAPPATRPAVEANKPAFQHVSTPALGRTAIDVDPIERQTPAGPIRGFVAVVALDDPTLDIVVTDPLPVAPAEGVEAILEPTDAWAERVNAVVAINANFFGWLDRGKGWSDVIGLSVSDGRVTSPRREHAGAIDYALVFDRQGLAHIVRPGDPGDDIYDAVAGVGPSPNAPTRDALLVTEGRNTGAHSRVAPEVRHPRTAVGVRDDGRTLVLIVIDGRQPGWSIGVTLPELADLMLEHGVDRAINLDGGGSTSFILRNPMTGDTIATNRPSDGQFRPVANHLGIRYDPAAVELRPEPRPGDGAAGSPAAEPIK